MHNQLLTPADLIILTQIAFDIPLGIYSPSRKHRYSLGFIATLKFLRNYTKCFVLIAINAVGVMSWADAYALGTIYKYCSYPYFAIGVLKQSTFLYFCSCIIQLVHFITTKFTLRYI